MQPDCLKGHVVCGTVPGGTCTPGINCKSRVLYPGPGFLSSAAWPLLAKKHYNGFINQSTEPSLDSDGMVKFHHCTSP